MKDAALGESKKATLTGEMVDIGTLDNIIVIDFFEIAIDCSHIVSGEHIIYDFVENQFEWIDCTRNVLRVSIITVRQRLRRRRGRRSHMRVSQYYGSWRARRFLKEFRQRERLECARRLIALKYLSRLLLLRRKNGSI